MTETARQSLGHLQQGAGLGQKPKTEPLWLGFSRNVQNGNRGWCIRVGWWWGCAFTKHEAGWGLGQKAKTEPPWLSFAMGLQEVERGAVGL